MKTYFKPAAHVSPLWWILLKILFQTVIFWSLFLFVIPGLLIWIESCLGWGQFYFSGQRQLGSALFILGGSLGLTSAAMMGIYGRGTPLPLDAARRLVVVGPYRYVRNPMAIAGLTQGAAIACYAGSWLTMIYVSCGMLLWNYHVRPIEEQDLLHRFQDEYVTYRDSVRCWFPCSKGYLPPLMSNEDLD